MLGQGRIVVVVHPGIVMGRSAASSNFCFDELTHRFMNEGWVTYTKRINSYDTLFLCTQLHILAALEVLASNTPFRKLETSTNISTEDHGLFFHLFLDKLYDIKDEYIRYPTNEEELKPILDRYESLFLPGCGGSIDVVHVKWSNRPLEITIGAKAVRAIQP